MSKCLVNIAKKILVTCDPKYAAKNEKYGDMEPPEVDEETRITLFRIFASYDRDQNGTLDGGELTELLKRVVPNSTAAEINRIYTKMDTDSNGRITYEEFCFGVGALKLDLAQSKIAKPLPEAYEWEIPFEELVLKNKLGEGSFGVVYQGSWRGTAVAVKKLKFQSMDEAVMADFKAETAILGKLRHPHVLLYLGACTVPPNLCIVTEFLAGGGLDEYAHKKRVPPKNNWTVDEALRKAVQVLQGLTYLHLGRPPIVHRDLKLQNVLLDKDFNVKLADFGLSCVRPSLQTMLTDRVGTPVFMAPELLLNRPYTEKVDIYSFGLCLWEMITGLNPYTEAKSLEGLTNIVVSGTRPAIPPSVPKEIGDLIQSCWHSDPAKRPDSNSVMRRIAQFQGLQTPSAY
mmetsp:Transcript_17222/g.29764  ORF Transcript_17222/g.29764 Transcript_17222/m.29764 type:complete len:401 (+) Transcript_17222:64-1266(+)